MSIYSELSGYILYYLNDTDEKHLNKIELLINRTFESIKSGENIDHTFSSGFSGLAWILEFLNKKKLLNIENVELLVTVDSLLESKMKELFKGLTFTPTSYRAM